MCLVVSSLLCDDIEKLLDCVVSLFDLERRSLSLQGLLRLLLFLHQTAVYVESSLITHQTRVMATVLAPLFADCAMDGSRDILLVDIASLLALHAPLFFPLETAPPSPLSSVSVERIHRIAQSHVTEFATCVVDLEKLAKEDAFECVYRGDVRFIAETHIHDSQENLEVFSKLLEVITDDAIEFCDVCEDGCSVSSLALNFACFSQNMVDATFQSDDLSFSEIARFFLRFYRLHARLQGEVKMLQLQRLATLLTQRLFLQTDADFASELCRDDVKRFLQETPLCAVEEIAGDGREMVRKLSADATAELPKPAMVVTLPVATVASIPVVSGKIPMVSGNGVSTMSVKNGSVNDGLMSNGPSLPVSNQPINSLPVSNQPVNGLPVNSQPINHQPIASQPINYIPVNSQSINQPINHQLINSQPINAQPVNQPVNHQPMNQPMNQPINNPPINHQPINHQPINNPPINPAITNMPLMAVKSGPIMTTQNAIPQIAANNAPINSIPTIVARADSFASPPPLPRGFLPTATPVPLARAASIPAVPLQSVPSLPIHQIPAEISIPLSPLPTTFPPFARHNETPSPVDNPEEDPFPRITKYLRDYVSRGISVSSLLTSLQLAETPSFTAESFLAANGASAPLDFFYVVSGSAVAPAEKRHLLALLQLMTETPLENRLFACVTALDTTAGIVSTQSFIAFIPAFSRLISAILPAFIDRFQRNAFDPQGFLKRQIPAISSIPAGEAAFLLRHTLEGIETVLQTSETPLPRGLNEWETTLGVRNVSPTVLREKLLGHVGNQSDWLTRLEFRGEVAEWLEACGAPATPISAGFAEMVFAREKEGWLLRVGVSRGIDE